MELLSLFIAGVAFVLVAAPAVLLLVTIFVLVPMAVLAPAPAMLGRVSFDCPVSRRHVDVAFLTEPGDAKPSDVVSCSLFPDGVRCQKGCLKLAGSAWAPSAMTARYALLAGGEAFR